MDYTTVTLFDNIAFSAASTYTGEHAQPSEGLCAANIASIFISAVPSDHPNADSELQHAFSQLSPLDQHRALTVTSRA